MSSLCVHTCRHAQSSRVELEPSLLDNAGRLDAFLDKSSDASLKRHSRSNLRPPPAPPQACLYWGAIKREWAHPVRASFFLTPVLTALALISGEPRLIIDGKRCAKRDLLLCSTWHTECNWFSMRLLTSQDFSRWRFSVLSTQRKTIVVSPPMKRAKAISRSTLCTQKSNTFELLLLLLALLVFLVVISPMLPPYPWGLFWMIR